MHGVGVAVTENPEAAATANQRFEAADEQTERGFALSVERTLRLAARVGNQLLAGARVRFEMADSELEHELARALGRLGARVATARDNRAERPDFVFTDAPAAVLVVRPRGAGELPTVVVPVVPVVPVSPAASAALSMTADTTEQDVGQVIRPDAAARIAWAAAGMPATRALAAELRESELLNGLRVGVSLVLEPKTAALALALRDAGASVAVFSAVSETDIDTARALAAEPRVRVFAPGAEPLHPVDTVPVSAENLDAAHAAAILDWAPELLIDDGAHLVRLAHTEHRDALATLRGASEETTSGVRPLREMAASGELEVPVIAVNDARTKTDFDNRIGTGQSCVFAIADLLDTPAAATAGIRPGLYGTRWAVIGYGPVGEGVARFAAALGARVTIVERDAERALRALHDGFEARSSTQSLVDSDVVVSATGMWHTVTAEHFATLRPGTTVAVAGGIDDELALDDLDASGWNVDSISENFDVWRAPGQHGQGIIVLAGGGGVNYTAAEGNPIEVMDLSFATQLAALRRLALGADADPAGSTSRLEPGVHLLPIEDELAVSRAALVVRGGGAEEMPNTSRPGGAAQHWRVHRYRRR